MQTYISNKIKQELELPTLDCSLKLKDLDSDSLTLYDIFSRINDELKVDLKISTFSDKTIQEIIDLYQKEMDSKNKGKIYVTCKIGEKIQYAFDREIKCDNSFNVQERHLTNLTDPLDKEVFEKKYFSDYTIYTNIPANE
ncbi:hypothetical protein DICPUDRAFT_74022 [Dictyostelium purpureum]|uniref:Carrier domain-containing protein n=1 Tax=Dictyostelium purpureum TaxID=5786 RepID=F0Z6J3_DICPU|nr:uncharacterized protein DICPUDRAFT_74022 [Dictyostelium purpureum]EGC40501.1 hypothetical protein DICPUDRAFT_74022 [Dictyostelium purpureum]|eukprot:XP_003283048.1 hypothetical protein DICPUDRAFT_74022 [Dictyostelium purpureum]